MSNDTLAWALGRLAERRRVVIASVIQTSGSVPGKVGAKLAVAEGKEGFHGTVGGAGLEMKVSKQVGHSFLRMEYFLGKIVAILIPHYAI